MLRNGGLVGSTSRGVLCSYSSGVLSGVSCCGRGLPFPPSRGTVASEAVEAQVVVRILSRVTVSLSGYCPPPFGWGLVFVVGGPFLTAHRRLVGCARSFYAIVRPPFSGKLTKLGYTSGRLTRAQAAPSACLQESGHY